MRQLRARGVAASALILGLVAACDSNPPTGPSEIGERGHTESGSEPGESGTQYGVTETARETRSGVDLVMRYDAGQERFTGTVTNTTNGTVSNVRVEIHLSNGVELGPTPRENLTSGQSRPVELDARGHNFSTWSVHVELGSQSS